jgi:hypothetical protein
LLAGGGVLDRGRRVRWSWIEAATVGFVFAPAESSGASVGVFSVFQSAVEALRMNNPPILRVEVSVVEDARRAVFCCFAGVLPDPKRMQVATVLTRALRAAGLLGQSIEQHYSAADVARLLGRSPDWVLARIRAGDFGACSRDSEWLIPASGVQSWLADHLSRAQEVAA